MEYYDWEEWEEEKYILDREAWNKALEYCEE